MYNVPCLWNISLYLTSTLSVLKRFSRRLVVMIHWCVVDLRVLWTVFSSSKLLVDILIIFLPPQLVAHRVVGFHTWSMCFHVLKTNRRKKVSSTYYMVFSNYNYLVDNPQLYQHTATTRSQVDHTCPMKSILDHLYCQRIYNKLN